MAEDIVRKELGKFHGIRAEVASHRVWGVPANTLVLHLPEKSRILSGRQGLKKVKAICNCYIPEPLWQILHDRAGDWQGYFKNVLKKVLIGLDLPLDEVAVLSTGVDMNQVFWAEESHEELWVLAFVTAGVKTNAMRIGKDRASGVERNGKFSPVGTINTIVLTDASLGQAALAASFITVTEAKIIALEELDIRSSYHPEWPATGTGTDQIVVVSGSGYKCTYVGGHTKLGELMARVVTRATAGAIVKRFKASE